VRPGLDHAAVIQYDDPVCLLGLRQPVRHDQRRTPLRSGSAGSLQLACTGTTRFSRGLIQYGDWRVSEHQASECDLLCLCTSQLMAALTNDGIQTIR
jgi:hypothetical protein